MMIRIILSSVIACAASKAAWASGNVDSCAGEARLMSFTAKEATFRNVDVSPDGKRIAFDVLGDVYSVPVSGGDAVSLTKGHGWNSAPVWSPDGSTIAFLSDRSGSEQAYVLPANGAGEARQVSFSDSGQLEGVRRSVEWLPNSRGLVVDGSLMTLAGFPVVGLDARGTQNLFYGTGGRLYQLRMNYPIGSEISDRLAFPFVLSSGHWEKAGAHSVAVSPLVMKISPVAISRDGRWVVYKARSSANVAGHTTASRAAEQVDVLRVIDQLSGEDRILVSPATSQLWRSNGSGGVHPLRGRMAITPDSKFLVTGFGGELRRIDLRTGEVINVPASIHVEKCMSSRLDNKYMVTREPMKVLSMRSTKMRPDGKQLTFSALNRIYIASVNDGDAYPLSTQNAGQFHPAYSPDGEWIAYVTWSAMSGGAVWRIPSNGGLPERLTKEPGYFTNPTWSPDGLQVAFVGDSDIQRERPGFSKYIHEGTLQMVSVVDKRHVRIPAAARIGHPLTFSAIGDRIIYFAAPPKAGRSSQDRIILRSVTRDGSKVSDYDLKDALPKGGPIVALPSPDGHMIAITKYGNLFVLSCRQGIGDEDFDQSACRERQLTKSGAYDPVWSKSGDKLEWAFSNEHFSMSSEDLREWNNSGERPLSPSITRIEMDVPRSIAEGTILLSNGKIVTMRGNEVIDGGSVLVKDGRIVEVGDASTVTAPDGAAVVDLRGKVVLPGFIDAHAHMTRMPRDLLDAKNNEQMIYLAFGVTTTKDPSSGGDHSFSYTELQESGEMVGPRRFGGEALVADSDARIDTFDDALGIADRTKKLGGTFLKYHNGWNRQQRQWIFAAARKFGLNVAAHYAAQNISGLFDFSTLVDGATSGEHGNFIDGVDIFSDVTEFIARSNVVVNASTTYGDYPGLYWSRLMKDERMQRFYDGAVPRTSGNFNVTSSINEGALPPVGGWDEERARVFAAIAAAGGRVSVGSHGDYDGVGFHLEMWAYARGGMSNHDVLRSATIVGAESLGVEADLGSIEVGKIADLIVLDENPLIDIRNTLAVEHVMQDGIFRDAKTLGQIWPERRPLQGQRPEAKMVRGEVSEPSLH